MSSAKRYSTGCETVISTPPIDIVTSAVTSLCWNGAFLTASEALQSNVKLCRGFSSQYGCVGAAFEAAVNLKYDAASAFSGRKKNEFPAGLGSEAVSTFQPEGVFSLTFLTAAALPNTFTETPVESPATIVSVSLKASTTTPAAS